SGRAWAPDGMRSDPIDEPWGAMRAFRIAPVQRRNEDRGSWPGAAGFDRMGAFVRHQRRHASLPAAGEGSIIRGAASLVDRHRRVIVVPADPVVRLVCERGPCSRSGNLVMAV